MGNITGATPTISVYCTQRIREPPFVYARSLLVALARDWAAQGGGAHNSLVKVDTRPYSLLAFPPPKYHACDVFASLSFCSPHIYLCQRIVGAATTRRDYKSNLLLWREKVPYM